MDGWAFLEEVRMDAKLQLPQVHIYMASSSEYPKDLERIEKDTLVKGYVPKPLTAEKVLEAAAGL
jgi:CheY-like chemotaxis protein